MKAVYIVGIIAITIVSLAVVNCVNNYITHTEVKKQLDKFEKAFPPAKPSVTKNDDLPKFGD